MRGDLHYGLDAHVPAVISSQPELRVRQNDWRIELQRYRSADRYPFPNSKLL